jgi:hypothetical protein
MSQVQRAGPAGSGETHFLYPGQFDRQLRETQRYYLVALLEALLSPLFALAKCRSSYRVPRAPSFSGTAHHCLSSRIFKLHIGRMLSQLRVLFRLAAPSPSCQLLRSRPSSPSTSLSTSMSRQATSCLISHASDVALGEYTSYVHSSC